MTSMSSQHEATTRDIPILLYDGTTVRNRSDSNNKRKRYSEIVVNVNGTGDEGPRLRTKKVQFQVVLVQVKYLFYLVPTAVN